MVELAWSERKIAFILSDSIDAKENFQKAGWTVFDEQAENVEEIFVERT